LQQLKTKTVPKYEGPSAEPKVVPKKKLLKWSFNIFDYNDRTGSAFKDVCWNVIRTYEVDKTLKADPQTIWNWLDLVEKTYEPEVPYHNSIHAADVLQALAYFLNRKHLRGFFSSADVAALVIATIVHDIHHPGFINVTLENLKHELSLKKSTPYLETHHVETAFKITLDNDQCNIFKALDPETLSWYEADITALILATDMDRHNDYCKNFREALDAAKQADGSVDWEALQDPEKTLLLKCMVLKNSDVAASQRPLHIHTRWSERISREFHRQTQAELQAHLLPVYPEYEELCIVPRTQLSFMEMVRPMVEDWDSLLGLHRLRANFDRAVKFWQNFQDRENCSFEEISDASKNVV
jgi:high affinity cAMP-specific and IBMX-insensitive 3',5'-cyclic phosphodiesterase 8